MQEFTQQTFTEERALFHTIDARISDSVFDVGESPLKECRKLDIDTTLFRYKYPLWYCKDVSLKNCTLFDMARAGIWYTDNVSIEDTVIEAPKNIRKADGVTLKNVSFPNAAETLWNCNNVRREIILPSTPTISRQTISRLSEIIHSTEQRTWSFATLSSSPRMLSGIRRM